MPDDTTENTTPSADDPVPGEGDPAAVAPKGGGEWPSKDTPPTAAAPGSDPAHASALQDERERRTADEGTPSSDLHPPVILPSVYDERPDEAAVGSSSGAARDEPEES